MEFNTLRSLARGILVVVPKSSSSEARPVGFHLGCTLGSSFDHCTVSYKPISVRTRQQSVLPAPVVSVKLQLIWTDTANIFILSVWGSVAALGT
eukprot:9471185-Ditylum_brightwellii.AAC.1